jgi:hypothetical protein
MLAAWDPVHWQNATLRNIKCRRYSGRRFMCLRTTTKVLVEKAGVSSDASRVNVHVRQVRSAENCASFRTPECRNPPRRLAAGAQKAPRREIAVGSAAAVRRGASYSGPLSLEDRLHEEHHQLVQDDQTDARKAVEVRKDQRQRHQYEKDIEPPGDCLADGGIKIVF